MIPVFLWCVVSAFATFVTFIVTVPDGYYRDDNPSMKWCLVPILLFIFPFLLREGTIETAKGNAVIQVSTEGVPFIVTEEDGESKIISLSKEFGRNVTAGTMVEVYTEIGKYVRFFYGEETLNKYRIIDGETK